LKESVLTPLADTMQEKNHGESLASNVIHWDVYLIAIANTAQKDLPV
jgi:hypothetical protein